MGQEGEECGSRSGKTNRMIVMSTFGQISSSLPSPSINIINITLFIIISCSLFNPLCPCAGCDVGSVGSQWANKCITYIMLQKYEQPEPPNDEYRLSELLSKLLTEFSHLIQSAFRLVLVLQEDQALQDNVIASFEHKLISSGFNLAGQGGQGKVRHEQGARSVNTYRRFLCRLVENIMHFRQRAEGSDAFRPVHVLIAKIQRAISEFQDSSNIGLFLQDIYQNFNHFLTALKKPSSEQPKGQTNNCSSPTGKKPVSTTRETRSKSFQIEPEYQRKLRKLLSNVNSRFKTLDCLDLDYAHFRSTYFQAKNINANDYFEDCMSRNYTIDCQIKDYERDYQEYTKRKDKRRTQKAMQLTSVNEKFGITRNYNQEKEATVYASRRISLKVNNWASEKQRTNRIETKKFSLAEQTNSFSINQLDPKYIQKQKSPEKQPTRIKYDLKMKSVILTASRINLQPCMQVHKVSIKNTLRQLQASRRKYYKFDQKPFLKNLRQLSQKYESLRKG